MIREAKPGEPNGDALDRYSLLHFASGAVAGAIGLPWLLFTAAAVGWEIAEDPLKREFPEVFPESSSDSKVNALADVLVGSLGFAAGAMVKKWLEKKGRKSK